MDESDIPAFFKEADADGNGLLSKQEMHIINRNIGSPITGPEIDELFKRLDSDNSHGVTMKEFKKILQIDF